MLGTPAAMVNIMNLSRRVLAVVLILNTIGAATGRAAPLRVLLLTGSNNHDWRATTPVIKDTLESCGRFHVDVETNVPAMTGASFANYDVVLSNFNTFGMKDPGPIWSADVRAAFLDFVRKGKGFASVHSGTSVFYDWSEFQQLAGTSWGKHTSHGQMHSNEVRIVTSHPITDGLKPFTTYDEFWQGVELAPGTTVLAEATPLKEFKGSGKSEPMAFITTFGDGRGFTLLLGHNTRAMESEGFKTLLRRGVEWAATGGVRREDR